MTQFRVRGRTSLKFIHKYGYDSYKMWSPLKCFKANVISAIDRYEKGYSEEERVERYIIFGVLRYATGAVAEADGHFIDKEGEKIKLILVSYLKISDEDSKVVLTAVKQAALEKLNYVKFVKEAAKSLSPEARISALKNLFRVAYADGELHAKEEKVIEKAAGLFGIGDSSLMDIKSEILMVR